MDNNSIEMEVMESDCEETRLVKLKEDILSVMACVLNYLSVSSYEHYYTLHHQECRKNMNYTYEKGTKTKSAITLESCKHFYECLKWLESVTDTDDPDYYEFRRKLRRFTISLASIKTSS
jgi:hypothetical protein